MIVLTQCVLCAFRLATYYNALSGSVTNFDQEDARVGHGDGLFGIGVAALLDETTNDIEHADSLLFGTTDNDVVVLAVDDIFAGSDLVDVEVLGEDGTDSADRASDGEDGGVVGDDRRVDVPFNEVVARVGNGNDLDIVVDMAPILVGVFAVDEDVAHGGIVDGDIDDGIGEVEDGGEFDILSAHQESADGIGIDGSTSAIDPTCEDKVLVGSSHDGDFFTFEVIAGTHDAAANVGIAIGILNIEGDSVIRENFEVGSNGSTHAGDEGRNGEAEGVVGEGEDRVDTIDSDGPVDETIAPVGCVGEGDEVSDLIGVGARSGSGGAHSGVVHSNGEADRIVGKDGNV